MIDGEILLRLRKTWMVMRQRYIATLVMINGEILLRVRKTWMVRTNVDGNTCPDRW